MLIERLPLRHCCTLVFFTLNLLLRVAGAQTETMLYSFAGTEDGGNPSSGVVADARGNLYGTTAKGGLGFGTVYKITSVGAKSILYSFGTAISDGAYPSAGVVRDAKGNLYGTAPYGGSARNGTVYKVTPAGKETTLYNFTGGSDGGNPAGPVVLDAQGNLYGTTNVGGNLSACNGGGCGTVFELSSQGVLTVLHSFSGNPDGENPAEALVFDAAGNLYGTTPYGGAFGYGTVFEVTPGGNETVLYNFTGGVDGAYPLGPVVLGANGNVFGLTSQGGISGVYGGVVFRLASGKETVLHRFGGSPDGLGPERGLVLSAGVLYGTTGGGGTSKNCVSGCGSIFQVPLSGKEKVLYSFTGSPDGEGAFAGLVRDQKGNMYGTTYYGGTFGYGAVFKFVP
jgi:uncharacterized repeat protein (TIGR03803 family)